MKPKFKIGDKVICIDDRPKPNTIGPDLEYKKEYIVKDIFVCECGRIAIDVGIKIKYGPPFINCECDLMIPGKDIHWCDPNRFEKPVEDSKENKEEIQMKFETKKLIKIPILQN